MITQNEKQKSPTFAKATAGGQNYNQKAPKENVEILLQETIELANILASSILTVKGKRTF